MSTDGVLRNLFISPQDVEGHPDVKNGLTAKRDRSLARGGHDLRQMLAMMREVDVVTPAGIFIGRDLALDFNNPLVHQFAERIIRALLSYEFKQSFFDGVFGWHLIKSPLPDIAYAGLAKSGKVRMVNKVFAYGVIDFSDNNPAWAVANFYGRIEMFIRAQKNSRALA